MNLLPHFIHASIHPSILYFHQSLSSFIHPSIHPSIHSSIHTSVRPLSIYPSIYPSIHQSINQLIHPSSVFISHIQLLSIHPASQPGRQPASQSANYPSIQLSIHPSIHTYIHTYIHTSVVQSFIYDLIMRHSSILPSLFHSVINPPIHQPSTKHLVNHPTHPCIQISINPFFFFFTTYLGKGC